MTIDLQQKLTELQKKIQESHENREFEQFQIYIKELNQLWEENSEEMKENARKEGFDV